MKSRARAGMALAGALLLAAIGAGPAQAHDALQSTSPERDATVTAAPETVRLTLSEPPTNSESLNLSVITVTDSTGKTLSDGKVTVTGPTISTTVVRGSNGPYKVLWRTVSSDGHPIEGNYTFNVQDPAVAAPASTVGSATATASATPTATANAMPTPAPRPDDSNAPLAVGIGAAVIAVLGGILYFAQRRRRGAGNEGH